MSENTTSTAVETIDSEVVLASSNSNAIQFYSSVPAQSFADKLAVLNSLDNAVKVDDNRGKVIQLKNFIVEPYSYTEKETGDVKDTARVTLIDDKGVGYSCSSAPVYNSLMRLKQLMGEPNTWPTPLPVTITKEGTAPRAYFSLKVTPEAMSGKK